MMAGSFIYSWLRMMVSAAFTRPTIDHGDWVSPDRTERGVNGVRRNTVAAAKRAALKAKRRKAHKARCR